MYDNDNGGTKSTKQFYLKKKTSYWYFNAVEGKLESGTNRMHLMMYCGGMAS